jgi:hypothetical protein
MSGKHGHAIDMGVLEDEAACWKHIVHRQRHGYEHDFHGKVYESSHGTIRHFSLILI